MVTELTFADFLKLAYNPNLVNERKRIFRDWYGEGRYDAFNRYFEKAQMLAGDTNVRNINYGAPVQDWLNYDTNIFSLFTKVPWGPKSALRFVDITASRASGIQETGELMAPTNATYGIIEYDIKYHDITLRATEKSLWRGGVDDNIDRWALERERSGQLLALSIDEFLARPVNTVTQATFVIDSIDRMISSSSEATFLVSSGGLTGATSADIYPYAQRLRRSGYAGTGFGNGPYDAVVSENAGTLRSIELKELDNLIRQVRLQGATMDGLIFLTGEDTVDAISAKLEGKQRFMETQRVVKTLNGVTRVSNTGVDAGFEVTSYRGIPFFTAKDLWNNRPSGGLTPLYGVYMPDVYIAVGLPVLYLETARDDWLTLDKMARKGGYFFGAELVFKRWKTHFKYRDISE